LSLTICPCAQGGPVGHSQITITSTPIATATATPDRLTKDGE
jgi:hypothetical protein